MGKMSVFWSLRVENAEVRANTFALQCKGDCFLSPNTKLASFNKAVRLSSEELARSFSQAVQPTLRRRYGAETYAIVVSCSTTGSSRIDDDLLVQARIEESLFTPNKRPLRLERSDLSSKLGLRKV
jgi:hypothetical protein